MASQKACKTCKTIYTGMKCPRCGSEEATTSFKGKIILIKPLESEIAKNLKIKEKGSYAIKT